ncbi:MAG: SOS response-associated peptidase [Eubacterium sp.]|nr:SOS response-associated peptidase [Eubacterium sp.]
MTSDFRGELRRTKPLPGNYTNMCGRYYFGEKTAKIAEKALGVYGGIGDAGDVTPGMSPLVITGRTERLAEENMLWGMANPKGGLIINARAESVYEKPMFSSSVETRRIIIPAEHFYEWDRAKNKVFFRLPESEILYLAGFFNLVNNREAFVILTTAANASMERVHDRMPLMIPEKDVADWILEPGKTKEFLQMKMPQLESWQEFEQMSFL